MAKGESSFKLSIEALDKFTKPFDGFAKVVEKSTKSVRTLGKELDIVKKRIGASLGLPKLKGALTDVGKSFSAVGDQLKSFAVAIMGIGAAAIGAGAGLYKMVRVYSDAMDEAVKSSQKAGISISAWQEMSYAAALSDVTNEQLIGSYQKLNRNMINAAKGGKTQAAAFKSLGITLTNSKGEIKATDTVMMEIAEAFSKMPDGAKKTAVAMDIFGKSGAQIIPLLNAGESGLKDLRREAEAIGVVFGDEDARAAEEFNDNITRLETRLRGLAFVVGHALLPVCDDIVKSFSQWIDANKQFISTKILEYVDKFKQLLPVFISKAKGAVEAIKNFAIKAWGLWEAMGGLNTLVTTLSVVMAGKFVTAILGCIGPIMKLSAALMATPVGWILLAVGAVVLIADKLGIIEPLLTGIQEGFSQAFNDFEPPDELMKLFTELKESLRVIGIDLDNLGPTFHEIGAFLGGMFFGVLNLVLTVLNAIAAAINAINYAIEWWIKLIQSPEFDQFADKVGGTMESVANVAQYINPVTATSKLLDHVDPKVLIPLVGPYLAARDAIERDNSATSNAMSNSPASPQGNTIAGLAAAGQTQTKVERSEVALHLFPPPGWGTKMDGPLSDHVTLSTSPSYLGRQNGF
ncbi:MAG: hypothetical protein LBO66_07720 [Deltaproteobacteria bacterium]|jgi:hypothetical protein|nr:hypothetical protein [Deltaproteobacteria bacterium]